MVLGYRYLLRLNRRLVLNYDALSTSLRTYLKPVCPQGSRPSPVLAKLDITKEFEADMH